VHVPLVNTVIMLYSTIIHKKRVFGAVLKFNTVVLPMVSYTTLVKMLYSLTQKWVSLGLYCTLQDALYNIDGYYHNSWWYVTNDNLWQQQPQLVAVCASSIPAVGAGWGWGGKCKMLIVENCWQAKCRIQMWN